MFKGAMGKRLLFFFSACLRFISFLGLMIAYVIVRLAVEPKIQWLNSLLLILSLLSLVTAGYNLAMCGTPATSYKQKFYVQVICFVITVLTGGILSSTLSGIATFMKVEDGEIENEGIINVKTFKREDTKKNEKSKGQK